MYRNFKVIASFAVQSSLMSRFFILDFRFWILILGFLISFPISGEAFTENGREMKFTYHSAGGNYLSAGVLEVASGKGVRVVSRIERDVEAQRLVETATVHISGVVEDTVGERGRTTTLGAEYSPIDGLELDGIVIFGLPTIPPQIKVTIEKSWRERIKIRYRDREVPATLVYTTDRVDSFLERDVAVIRFILNGVEVTGDRTVRWAGVGREVWNIEDNTPVLRLLELRRTRPSDNEVTLKLSYAESILF